MKPLGLILVALALLFPLVWFIPLASRHEILAVFSQYLGSAALIAMGIVQLLATRFRGIEAIFGGLDRVYVLHKWLAVSAIAAAALHDTIDADMDGIGQETWLTDIAESMGEIGFYGLLILGVVTVITFVPYHYWKWSHRFMGFFFAMAAFHYLYILKPFAVSDPLGLYVAAFCLLGILCYLYLLVPNRWLLVEKDYVVSDINRYPGVVEVTLQPVAGGIRHKAGQFAFVSFEDAELRENHPFTISSRPNSDNAIRISVKSLGDFTVKLGNRLETGMEAKVSRAFGHFQLPPQTQDQVWIAAGIGVTPFVAWAQSLDESHEGKITFYYCCANRSEAMYLEDLEAIASGVENLRFVPVFTSDEPRLSGERIATEAEGELEQKHVYFCGPKSMRTGLMEDLTARGLRPRNFHFEEFEIRSGIGVLKVVEWVLAKLSVFARRPAEG